MEAMMAKRKTGTGPISTFACPACGDKMMTNEVEEILLHNRPMCPEWAQYTENWKGYENGGNL